MLLAKQSFMDRRFQAGAWQQGEYEMMRGDMCAWHGGKMRCKALKWKGLQTASRRASGALGSVLLKGPANDCSTY
jgi:hypothetical protein